VLSSSRGCRILTFFWKQSKCKCSLCLCLFKVEGRESEFSLDYCASGAATSCCPLPVPTGCLPRVLCTSAAHYLEPAHVASEIVSL
jgi:hypothetical protein